MVLEGMSERTWLRRARRDGGGTGKQFQGEGPVVQRPRGEVGRCAGSSVWPSGESTRPEAADTSGGWERRQITEPHHGHVKDLDLRQRMQSHCRL